MLVENGVDDDWDDRREVCLPRYFDENDDKTTCLEDGTWLMLAAINVLGRFELTSLHARCSDEIFQLMPQYPLGNGLNH